MRASDRIFTYLHFVEIHPLNKFFIQHLILFHRDFIVYLIWVFCGAIPTLGHDLEIRLVWQRCDMKFPVVGDEESAQCKSLLVGTYIRKKLKYEEVQSNA